MLKKTWSVQDECFKTRFILQAIEKFVKQLEVIHFRQRIVQHTKSSCFTIIKKIYGSYIKVFCRIDFFNDYDNFFNFLFLQVQL